MGGSTKMAKSKSTIELKYSLRNEEFTTAIGKRRAIQLRDAISNWVKDKKKRNADALTDVYVQSLLAYWKKTKQKDLKKYEVTKDSDLIVDLVYKKGRKPNTIRLENNPVLKEELLKLHKAK